MLNLNDDNAFLGDVSFSVYSLMCKYCEAMEDKNPKCQIPSTRVMHLWVMLILVYIIWCVDIAKQ
jgi:hypothetical protein